MLALRLLRDCGTSPRMRGKRIGGDWILGLGRNIPAYAGKTHVLFTTMDGLWEHPRVCGENKPAKGGGAGKCGTSPRMRGKRAPSALIAGSKRNIPAYAGKTLTMILTIPSFREHPRVCGENVGHLVF